MISIVFVEMEAAIFMQTWYIVLIYFIFMEGNKNCLQNFKVKILLRHKKTSLIVRKLLLYLSI